MLVAVSLVYEDPNNPRTEFPEESLAEFAADALSPLERAEMPCVANEPRFADVPTARIVPTRADQGVNVASESTFGRMLREHGRNAHGGGAKAPRATRQPTTHIASGTGQLDRRCAGNTRDWSPVDAVRLNFERDSVATAHVSLS